MTIIASIQLTLKAAHVSFMQDAPAPATRLALSSRDLLGQFARRPLPDGGCGPGPQLRGEVGFDREPYFRTAV